MSEDGNDKGGGPYKEGVVTVPKDERVGAPKVPLRLQWTNFTFTWVVVWDRRRGQNKKEASRVVVDHRMVILG